MKDTVKLFIWFLILCAWLLLPGCSTVAHSPIEVKIPIPIKCKVETPLKPEVACYADKYNKTKFDIAKCIAYEKDLNKIYEKELVAALESCK